MDNVSDTIKSEPSPPSKQIELARKPSFLSFSPGPGNPLGTATPQDFKPVEIRYYKLSLGAGGGIHFQFLPESGVVKLDPNNTQADSAIALQNFIKQVMAGTPETTEFQVRENAPDITTYFHCYVVIELDANVNWRFLCGSPAIMMAPAVATSDPHYQDHYFGLVHMDTGAGSTAATAPKNKTCRVAYFSTTSRTALGDPTKDNDAFNMFLESDQGFGKLLPIALDPDIRNEGGTIPPFI